LAPSGTAGAWARGQARSSALATSTRLTGEGAGVDTRGGAARDGDREPSAEINPQPRRAAPATPATRLHAAVRRLGAALRRRGASSAVSISSAPRARAPIPNSVGPIDVSPRRRQENTAARRRCPSAPSPVSQMQDRHSSRIIQRICPDPIPRPQIATTTPNRVQGRRKRKLRGVCCCERRDLIRVPKPSLFKSGEIRLEYLSCGKVD